MTTVRRTMLGIAAVSFLLLASSRPASAGIVDIIWGMSGPQMIGLVSECNTDLVTVRPVCRLLGWRVVGTDDDEPFADQASALRKIWLTLDGTFYFSDGKNSDGNNSENLDYKKFDYYMVAFEPMLQLQSYHRGSALAVYHGLMGLSYDMLFGAGFDAFDNIGVKFRPIAITYKRFDIAYNLRIYPRGFTSDDFGVPSSKPTARPDNETVHGFTIGFRW